MYNNHYTLITGASEGLGKALALECAHRKMNLILVALPGPELYQLAGLIRRNYCVDVIAIEKDLCEEQSCTALFDEINKQNLQVNMLINNAGTGSTLLFEEGSINLYEKQIKLNVLATTIVARLFLEMLKRNNNSYILNVGSMASFFYLPKKTVYGATKSFIYFLSKTLRKEMKKHNIHVSILCPGAMNTNLPLILMYKTGNYLSRLSVMDPEKVAHIAINGLLKNKELIIPGRLNKCFLLLDKLLPGFIKKILTNSSMKKLNPDNRFNRYLAKPSGIRTAIKAA